MELLSAQGQGGEEGGGKVGGHGVCFQSLEKEASAVKYSC